MFAKKRVYADAAAATPLSGRAKAELGRLLALCGNPGALHREGLAAKKALEQARTLVGKTVGAHPDEIVFVGSGTEANNLAITGVLRPLLRSVRTSDVRLHAVTCVIEHPSVLEPLRALARGLPVGRHGLELTELEVDQSGLVDPEALRRAIKENTVFVSIQLVNSEVGTIEPIKEIAKIIRQIRTTPARALRAARPSLTLALSSSDLPLPIYFHTDASQAPLWMPLAVEALGVDLLTLDAQKVLGPKGVGALYIKRGTPVEPLLRGGGQERGLRGGTENVPLAGAFAVALQDAQSGVETRAEKISAVRDYLIAEIQRLLPDAVFNGPTLPEQGETLLNLSKVSPCSRVANNINVSIPGLEGEMATLAMDARGIAVSTRSACSVGDEEPSYVIAALLRSDLSLRYPGSSRSDLWRGRSAIRITLLPDATLADARRIARELAAVAARYRVL